MKRFINYSVLTIVFVFGFSLVYGQAPVSGAAPTSSPVVRIKDIGNIIEARDNQILGFGLVVGLRNTGDSRSTAFTKKALTNLLKKMGVSPDKKQFNSRNVASVMVTATLPPYTKKGQRIDVLVSSLGDSSSLVGGTLLMTPLQGADFNTYAVAQGSLVVGGISEKSSKGSFRRNLTTVGRVVGGAIVEREVPITMADQDNITVVLHKANFATASRASVALQKAGFKDARAVDPGTLKIPISALGNKSFVETIADIENVELTPDMMAKIVVNSRTGTVVIGQQVRLFPVAISHGSLSIKIEGNDGAQSSIAMMEGTESTGVQVIEKPTKLIHLEPKATLASLVEALNEIGVTPKDLISILEALKSSGSLIAELEVI
ncbi:flagellar biosynthesis protein FlgA [Candidatus Marinamargulisbacteria bacterium SCGC AG-439-L15]|nr:flagellar biosynthesis protein FlgA [Candidatus Marinamargulisbacteria bacterium SCGC AG-439-L15]